MIRTRKICIFIAAFVMICALAACLAACNGNKESGGNTSGHTHVAGEWISDGTSHWHKCSECGDIFDKEGHTPSEEWVEDNAATCQTQAHHHKECTACQYHTEEEFYGEQGPHALGDWIEDSPASCTAKALHHKECENCGYTEEEYYGDLLPHSWNEDTNKCDVCGADKPLYEERDGKIYFGEYPQTKVEDNGIISTLNGMSGDRPVKGNSGKWTDYGYYISGKVEEYMWYIDLEYGGERYRGVYFTSYRPYYTTSSSSNSDQDDNGYYTNKLYWFKWEPIEWRVLERTDGEAFLMSNVILDSQQYYRTYSGTRSIDGKTIYPNNYKESDIRAWLNGTFYNQAFDEFEQAIIKETLVDNSASTTASSSNSYACENTNDKVFLLSYKDVLNTKYGFNSSNSNYDTTRQLKTTGYAQSQGAYTSTDSSYRGNGFWWLRSPYYYSSGNALNVNGYGHAYYDSVYGTRYGVVPAIKIAL